MQAEFYDELQELSLELVNALVNQNAVAEKIAYAYLSKLCHLNEGKENDHPFQWELLGDYTKDDELAKLYYLKSIELARQHSLNDYECTSALALAYLYHNSNDVLNTKKMFLLAKEKVDELSDPQLKEDLRILSDLIG